MRNALILLTLLIMLPTTPAHACDCKGNPVSDSASRAESIHIVTPAGIERDTDSGQVTVRLNRIFTFKGDDTPETLTLHSDGLSNCFPRLQEDQPGLFFFLPHPDNGLTVSICAHSDALETQARLGDLQAFIELEPEPVRDVAHVIALLEAANFKAYLHGADVIFVHLPDLGGTTVDFHGTELRFIHAIDGLPQRLLAVDFAVSRGPLTQLNLRYDKEGLFIQGFLLETEARGLEVVESSVIER